MNAALALASRIEFIESEIAIAEIAENWGAIALLRTKLYQLEDAQVTEQRDTAHAHYMTALESFESDPNSYRSREDAIECGLENLVDEFGAHSAEASFYIKLMD